MDCCFWDYSYTCEISPSRTINTGRLASTVKRPGILRAMGYGAPGGIYAGDRPSRPSRPSFRIPATPA